MAQQLPTASEAQRLRDQGVISDDQFNKIVSLSPMASEAPPASPSPEMVPQSSPQPASAPAPEVSVQKLQDVQAPIQQAINERIVPNYAEPQQPIPETIARPVSLTTDAQGKSEGHPQNDMYSTMMGNINKPYDMMQAAAIEGMKVGAAKGAEQAATIQKITDTNSQRIASDETARVERQGKLDDVYGKLQNKIDEVSNMKVDPNKFWANKSTGDKILAGISLFLGAAGGVNGRGNSAVPVIQNAIQADIDAQKANIGIKQDGVNQAKGMYGQMLNTYHDRDLAEAATTAAYYKNTENQLSQIAAKYQGPETKAKAMEALAQIQGQRQEAQMKFMQLYQSLMPVGPNTNVEMLPKDKRERYVPGYTTLALSEDGAKTMRAASAATNQAKKYIDELIGISTISGRSLSPELRSRAGQLSQFLTAALKDPLFDNAKFTANEMEFASKLAGDPTDLWSYSDLSRSKLNNMKSALDIGLDAKAEANGLKSPMQQLGIRKVSTN